MFIRTVLILVVSCFLFAQNGFGAEMYSFGGDVEVAYQADFTMQDGVEEGVTPYQTIGEIEVGHHHHHHYPRPMGVWFIAWGIAGICVGVSLLAY